MHSATHFVPRLLGVVRVERSNLKGFSGYPQQISSLGINDYPDNVNATITYRDYRAIVKKYICEIIKYFPDCAKSRLKRKAKVYIFNL